MSGIPWADGVAVVHAAVVALVLGGGFAAWRRPGLRRLHLPVLAGTVAVNLTGSPCPLTVLELRLRAAEGRPPYAGGFVGHYLVEPVLGTGQTAPALSGLVCAAAVVPNVVAYGVPLLRWCSGRRRGRPVEGSQGRPGRLGRSARSAGSVGLIGDRPGQWLVVPRRDSSRGGTRCSATSPVARA